MQLHHQQQHLKKMRQRLPHNKNNSPHLLRKDPHHIPSAALLGGAKFVGTPDTLSEAGSMKSRSRKVLPYLPPEEPAPLPAQAKKSHDRMRAYANLRQSSLDGLTGRGTSAFSTGAFTRPRPSSSETNLRKLAMGDQFNRPGSALGLLQAASVVSSHGPTNATKEHEKRILESILPPDLRHLVRGGSSGTIQHIKTKLEEDMRTTQSESGVVPESDIARRNAERRLFGSLGTQSDRIRQEMQRYASMRDPTLRAKMKHNLNPVMNAQLDRNRRFKGHRRNLSDPRFSTSLTDAYGEDQMDQFGRPFSSTGYRDDPFVDTLGMENSRSYLGGSRLSGTASLSGLDGGLHSGLRDTAMYGPTTGYDGQSDDRNRYLSAIASPIQRRRISEFRQPRYAEF